MSAGRLVLPALRWRPETGFAHESAAIDRALSLGVAGFIVFGTRGPRWEEIARLTEDLRCRAGRPLLIGADLERGPGQQARGLSECPPPLALASLEDPEAVRWAGRVTGREAREMGVNWVFAPVCDLDLDPENPIVQTRSFGAEPRQVSQAVRDWIGGCQAGGVMACAKHYPGHGRATADSHAGQLRVETGAGPLRECDEAPFRAAVQAGVRSVMTAHVAFPALDPTGAPATLSSPILSRLRQELGFGGLVVTDALIMEGVRTVAGPPAPVRALGAGCDLLLYPDDPVAAAAAIAEGVAQGTLAEQRLTESLERLDRALDWLAHWPGEPETPGVTARGEAADQIADRLLLRGMLRGDPPGFPAGFELSVVDDDLDGWYPPGPSHLVVRELARRKLFERWGGDRIVLVLAGPRAGKRRAGLGERSRSALARLLPGAALVVLFGHPRLASGLGGATPILCAWDRQDLMQRAVARWIAPRLGVR
jgi:beta-glucosidase